MEFRLLNEAVFFLKNMRPVYALIRKSDHREGDR